ncbi:MAG: oxidoreductase [Spirochaeta sp. LUC14_002_19_P3]|nr:MAG: oxidoreductase [Spirochaeta sp. LUC14_002_19_P3]
MKPIKLGVLGVSKHYGLRMHTPLCVLNLFETRAIGSRQRERAVEAAEKWGFSKAYGSYQQVVDDKEVEAVYIPLTNNLHAEWIKKCADAGKAVLCEKPLTLNAAEAADALEYADKKGIMVMEAFMYKFHPQWIKARETMDIGEIGEAAAIHTVFSFFNNDAANIRNQRALGGGAVYDIGCYAISSARLLMNREPLRVMANIEEDPICKVDTLVSAILDFGGPRALFTVSTRMAPMQNVSVYGRKGSLTLKRPFNAYRDSPLTLELNDGNGGPRTLHYGPSDQYGEMLKAFAQALNSGSPAPLPPEDALANMKVIDAIFRSGKSGEWEKV